MKKITPGEAYRLYQQHESSIQVWNDEITIDVLTRLIDNGYILPQCYAFYYDFTEQKYHPVTIKLAEDALSDADNKEGTYQFLQKAEKLSPHALLAIKFISEGLVDMRDTGERVSFLLMTLETAVRGWKRVYTMEKTSYVEQGGSTRLKVDKISYDKDISGSCNVPLIEEFAHILRPNYSDSASYAYN